MRAAITNPPSISLGLRGGVLRRSRASPASCSLFIIFAPYSPSATLTPDAAVNQGAVNPPSAGKKPPVTHQQWRCSEPCRVWIIHCLMNGSHSHELGKSELPLPPANGFH